MLVLQKKEIFWYFLRFMLTPLRLTRLLACIWSKLSRFLLVRAAGLYFYWLEEFAITTPINLIIDQPASTLILSWVFTFCQTFCHMRIVHTICVSTYVWEGLSAFIFKKSYNKDTVIIIRDTNSTLEKNTSFSGREKPPMLF